MVNLRRSFLFEIAAFIHHLQLFLLKLEQLQFGVAQRSFGLCYGRFNHDFLELLSDFRSQRGVFSLEFKPLLQRRIALCDESKTFFIIRFLIDQLGGKLSITAEFLANDWLS